MSKFDYSKYQNCAANFSDIIGKTFSRIEVVKNGERGDEIIFWNGDQPDFLQCHIQDCCEDVHLEEIIGDLQDLVGTEILEARVDQQDIDSQSIWTFYNIRTIKGSVTLRWYGSSEYYSIEVSFFKLFWLYEYVSDCGQFSYESKYLGDNVHLLIQKTPSSILQPYVIRVVAEPMPDIMAHKNGIAYWTVPARIKSEGENHDSAE